MHGGPRILIVGAAMLVAIGPGAAVAQTPAPEEHPSVQYYDVSSTQIESLLAFILTLSDSSSLSVPELGPPGP